MARRVGHQRAEIIAAANALRVLPFLLDADAANSGSWNWPGKSGRDGSNRKRWLRTPRSSRLRAAGPKLWT